MTPGAAARFALLVGVLAAVGTLVVLNVALLHRTPGGTSAVAAPQLTPTPGTETTPLIFDLAAHTARSLPLDHLFHPLPLADGSLLVADTVARRWEVVRVDGSIVQHLPLAWPDVYPTPSADGRYLAFGEDKLLHVYELASGVDRTIDTGTDPASEQMLWSPDDREIALAMGKVNGSPLLVEVVDVTTGKDAWRMSSPAGGYSNIPHGADVGVRILRWTSDTEFEYRVWSPLETQPFCCGIAQGGQLYADTAHSGRTLSELDRRGPWSQCPGGCAPLPPVGFENPDGIVSWCSATQPDCRPVLGVVDRAVGVVRQLVDGAATAIALDYAVSPEGATLALTLRDETNHQRLRLVDVATGAWKDYALPYVNEGHNIRWFPDGRSLVLWFPGT